MKKKAAKTVAEPYRTANRQWYHNALNDFWRKNEKANVIDTGNEGYSSKRPNPGGGSTRGENARIIFNTPGAIKITGINCRDSKMGDCVWKFEVKAVSKGSPKVFKPEILLQHTGTQSQWLDGQEYEVANKGEIKKWSCQCSDFKYRKSVCKHILAATVAMNSRIKKVSKGTIK